MKDITYVIGHKHPDTDSIASAITYSYLLNKKNRNNNVIPVRLGDLNSETKFVLEYFNHPAPLYLPDVEPRLDDLKTIRLKPKITSEDSIKKAFEIMMDTEISVLPIVDQKNVFIGNVVLSDILRDFMQTLDYSLDAHDMYYQDIVDVLDGTILVGDFFEKKTKIEGRLLIDTTLKVDEKCDPGDIIILGQNEFLMMNALKSGAGFFIISKDTHLLSIMKKITEKKSAILVKVKYDVFQTIKLLNLVVPIRDLMTTEDLYLFYHDDYIKDFREIIKTIDVKHQHFPMVDRDKKLIGIITRNLDFHPKKVILVDHNERTQTVNGIEKAQVVEVIDHHKLSDIQSNSPIFVYCKPVGSTATLIWERFKQENVEINKQIAGLMLSAILSDTLLLTSPTTTALDKFVSSDLAEISGIDINTFGSKMINVSASIEGKSIEELFESDLKVYSFKGKKFVISQINSIDHTKFHDKFDFQGYLEKVRKENSYIFTILMITDVVLNGSEMFFAGERKDIINNAFNIDQKDNSVFLKGVVSRKKQVVPPILKSLSKISI